MKILVTGGLGYVGGRFAELASAEGKHSLVLTTRRAADRPAWAAELEVACVSSDDDRELARLCRGVDVVIQLGGMNAAQSAREPARALQTRAASTAALLRAATASGVRRMIHVSTIHVYGKALSGLIDENTPAAPAHPYAYSHLAAERPLLAAGERDEIESVVVRLSNAYGAPMDAEVDCWTLVTNDLCRQAMRSRRMILNTTGRQRRNFIAMSEVCRGLLHLCDTTSKPAPEGIYNLGSEESLPLLEQANRIAAAVKAQTGVLPLVVTGEREDLDSGTPLDYLSRRIRASGFEPAPEAGSAELVRLARYCARSQAVQ